MPILAEVLEAETARNAAIAHAKMLRAQLQLDCAHAHTLEARTGSAAFERPFRVCVDCGLAEEGWSCGYQILRGEPERERVDRVEANLHRVGPAHANAQFVGYIPDVQALGGVAAYRRAKLAEVLGVGPKVQDTRPDSE
jgi:hypothetical protein